MSDLTAIPTQALVDVLQRVIDLAEQAEQDARAYGLGADEAEITVADLKNAFLAVDPLLYGRLTPTAGRPDTFTRQQVVGLNDKQRDTLIIISLQTSGTCDKICASRHVVVASANSLITRGLARRDWSARTGNGYVLTLRGRRAAEMLALEPKDARA